MPSVQSTCRWRRDRRAGLFRRTVLGAAIFGSLAMAAFGSPAAYIAFESGNRLLRLGQYEQAATEFRKALANEPDFAAAHNNLGVALYRQGHYDEALEEFQNVVQSEEAHKAGARLNMGAANAAKGEPAAALKEAEEAARAQPDFAEAHFNIGWIRDWRGELAEAEAAYREAIRLKPNYVKAEIGLAIVLAKMGRFTDAATLVMGVADRSNVTEEDRTLALKNLEAIRIHAALANPNPPDGATDVPADAVTLAWGVKISADPAPALTFNLRLGPDRARLAEATPIAASDSTWRVDHPLRRGQTYFWQVLARTADGLLASSPIYSFTCRANRPPVADIQANVSTQEDTPVEIILTGTDGDGDPLTFRVQEAPQHGSLSGDPPRLLYTPTSDFSGSDRFTFVANDGSQDSAPALVGVLVRPVDDPPQARPPSGVRTSEDVAVEVELGGWDPDGNTLVFRIVSPPAHGTLSGTGPKLIYTPMPNFHGTDRLTYVVSDGVASSAVTPVDLIIEPVNDPPKVADLHIETDQNAPVVIGLTSSDAEAENLQFKVTVKPEHGTLVGTPPRLTYAPAKGYAGPDEFRFTASDGSAESEPATVFIIVRAVAFFVRHGTAMLAAFLCGAAAYAAIAVGFACKRQPTLAACTVGLMLVLLGTGWYFRGSTITLAALSLSHMLLLAVLVYRVVVLRRAE